MDIRKQGRTVALLALFFSGTAARADYLTDARTKRPVSFTSPRAGLGECLRVLSEATGVTLTTVPSLANDPLTGFVPRRPLYETMTALAELFDGIWIETPGERSQYRLEPDPVKAKAAAKAKAEVFKSYRKMLDDQATTANKRARHPLPSDQASNQELLPALLWGFLRPSDRDRVLSGVTVTISIPEKNAHTLAQVIVTAAGKKPAELIAPVLASFDLDDGDETFHNGPLIRARATELRQNSCVGAIGIMEFMPPPVPAPKPAVDDPVFPMGMGDSAEIDGSADDIVVKVGQAYRMPVLSRVPVRSSGDSVHAVNVGGRKLSQVAAETATHCRATSYTNAQGYVLLRSQTEAFDRSELPDPAVVDAYLKRRPSTGFVHFDPLSELSPLSPAQMFVLTQSNVCTNEAKAAARMLVVMRFYRSLTVPQREALFSAKGLEASSLTHAQLHAFLDQKSKRAGLEIHEPLQEIQGLRFRFSELEKEGEPVLHLEALRGEQVLANTDPDPGLPKVDVEDRPAAKR